MNKEQLIQFEEDVVKIFNDGQLRSPVHLSGSTDGVLENYLIKLFKQIGKHDWLFTTYRSHYHALLKGLEPEILMSWVKANKSIHVMDKKYKIFTSAIVGGCLPIALGAALAIKLKGGNEKVWIFCGDMTAESGQFNEVFKYARVHNLPLKFVIEDNGLSTDTDTREVWGSKRWYLKEIDDINLFYIQYKRKFPHYGTGKFIDKLWSKDDVKSKGF